jgi:hypothetical protein
MLDCGPFGMAGHGNLGDIEDAGAQRRLTQ